MSNKKPTIELLESIRRIVYRWVNTQTPLTADVAFGATTLYVESTKRWAKGDQLAIIDYEREVHEPFLVVDEVVDDTTLTLSTPIQVNAGWTVANNSVIRKSNLVRCRNVEMSICGSRDGLPNLECSKSRGYPNMEVEHEVEKPRYSRTVKAPSGGEPECKGMRERSNIISHP